MVSILVQDSPILSADTSLCHIYSRVSEIVFDSHHLSISANVDDGIWKKLRWQMYMYARLHRQGTSSWLVHLIGINCEKKKSKSLVKQTFLSPQCHAGQLPSGRGTLPTIGADHWPCIQLPNGSNNHKTTRLYNARTCSIAHVHLWNSRENVTCDARSAATTPQGITGIGWHIRLDTLACKTKCQESLLFRILIRISQ